jgi:hypothetical protein
MRTHAVGLMLVMVAGVAGVAVGVGPQSYPPPFPRPGVTKLLDNSRVVVWNIAWPKGEPTALHRHIYDLVGTYYTSGDRVITEVDGSKRNVTNKAGEITFRQKGLTHIRRASVGRGAVLPRDRRKTTDGQPARQRVVVRLGIRTGRAAPSPRSRRSHRMGR